MSEFGNSWLIAFTKVQFLVLLLYETSFQRLKIYINILNKWVIKHKIKSLALSMIFLLFIILKTCKTTHVLTSINKLLAPKQPTIFITMYILVEQSNSFSLSWKPGHIFFFLSLGYETPPPNSFLKKKKNKTHLPDLTTYFKLNISVDRGPLQK